MSETIAIQIFLKGAFAFLIPVGTLTIQDNPNRNHGPLVHILKEILVGGNECRDILASMFFRTEEEFFCSKIRGRIGTDRTDFIKLLCVAKC